MMTTIISEKRPPDRSIVMIVDDDSAIRDSLDSLFRSVGLETRLFSSPAELLGTSLPRVSGCIVLDVRLPGVSGLDLQGQLLKQGMPDTQRVFSCGFDFAVADTTTAFHNYGVLWQPDRITYFIDRKPASEIKVPVGFDDPMYMIVNLAMGSNHFPGVGFVDGQSPVMVEFQIDRISAYQIDQH